jgi:hypothetical protein
MGLLTRDIFFESDSLVIFGAPSLTRGRVCHVSVFVFEVYSSLGYAVPGGYKYGDLALQVGGVSDETVKYGREF